MALERVKEGGPVKPASCLAHININILWRETATYKPTRLRTPHVYPFHLLNNPSISRMFSYGNSFASSSSSGYLDEQNNDLYFHGYPFDMAKNEPPAGTTQTTGFGLDASITDLSTASTEDWWVGSLPNDDLGQHSGSTIFDVSWSGFADPDNFHTGPTPGDNVSEYNESLSEDNSSSQSPYLTFEGKGKARATDHVPPPTYPVENDNTSKQTSCQLKLVNLLPSATAWEGQWPHTPQHHCTSSTPYTVCRRVRSADVRPIDCDPTEPGCFKNRPFHRGCIFI